MIPAIWPLLFGVDNMTMLFEIRIDGLQAWMQNLRSSDILQMRASSAQSASDIAVCSGPEACHQCDGCGFKSTQR